MSDYGAGNKQKPGNKVPNLDAFLKEAMSFSPASNWFGSTPSAWIEAHPEVKTLGEMTDYIPYQAARVAEQAIAMRALLEVQAGISGGQENVLYEPTKLLTASYKEMKIGEEGGGKADEARQRLLANYITKVDQLAKKQCGVDAGMALKSGS